MRISRQQIHDTRHWVAQLAGDSARVWLFGSRVNDDARGGDVDLMLEVDSEVAEPALLAAQLAAKVSRSMQGRKVDVLIKAPNLLHLPIHTVVMAQGLRL